MTRIAREVMRPSMVKVLRALEIFRQHDQTMPMQQAVVFMIIAMNEGCSLTDITDRLGLRTSSASRNVAALSKVHRLGKPGHDLIEYHEDPLDRRRKVHRLTAKGCRLVNQLNDIMED